LTDLVNQEALEDRANGQKVDRLSSGLLKQHPRRQITV
jgi:hypothetical protein